MVATLRYFIYFMSVMMSSDSGGCKTVYKQADKEKGTRKQDKWESST